MPSFLTTHTANAVSHQDNLQFLEDIIPKTVPYKQIKAHAAATRANLSGGSNNKPEDSAATGAVVHEDPRPRQTNGKKQKGGRSSNAGERERSSIASFVGASGARIVSEDADDGGDADVSMDPNEQLQDEIRRAANREDEDVDMAD